MLTCYHPLRSVNQGANLPASQARPPSVAVSCVSCDLRQVSREQGNVGGGLLAVCAVWAGCRAATALLCWLVLPGGVQLVAALSCGVAVGAGATGGSSE